MNSPCKNCKDRKAEKGYNCHSDCEKYLEYKDFRDKFNQEKADRASRMVIHSSAYYKRMGRESK